MTPTLEIPTPSDPVGPVVPETPSVPADPVPGPVAPDTPGGPDAPEPNDPLPLEPDGPDVAQAWISPILAAPRRRGSPSVPIGLAPKGTTLRMLGRSPLTAPTTPRHPR